MKIFHHTNELGIGGTEKTACLFVKYLNDIKGVQAYMITKSQGSKDRLSWCEDQGIPVIFYDDYFQYQQIVKDADIVHFHRGGWKELPCCREFHSEKTKLCETNIFGHTDASGNENLDLSFFLGKSTMPRLGIPCIHLPNPIEFPNVVPRRLTEWNRVYNVTEPFLCGKVQRPDDKIFEPHAHQAISNFDFSDYIRYEVVNPCQTLLKGNYKNHRWREPLIYNDSLNQFWQSCDIFLHCRKDGETFGCAIFEAMANGVPVLTHVSERYNNHISFFQENELFDWIVPDVTDIKQWEDSIIWAKEEMEDPRTALAWNNVFYNVARNNVEVKNVTGKLLLYYERYL